MSIEKLYGGDDLSHADCQKINEDLSGTKSADIPVGQRAVVEEYLADVLSHGAVEDKLVESLDRLLNGLREEGI